MNNIKSNTIFLSVIGIAALLVAVIGATFAWFSISINGNDNAQDMVITTATLGSITFTDGDAINAANIYPGAERSKTFTVAQTDNKAIELVNYNVVLNINSNTLTPVAAGQFVHSLTSTGNTNGGTLGTLAESVVPTTTTTIATGTISGYETHSYTYTIKLKNVNADQNACQGKTFDGYITIDLIDSMYFEE